MTGRHVLSQNVLSRSWLKTPARLETSSKLIDIVKASWAHREKCSTELLSLFNCKPSLSWSNISYPPSFGTYLSTGWKCNMLSSSLELSGSGVYTSGSISEPEQPSMVPINQWCTPWLLCRRYLKGKDTTLGQIHIHNRVVKIEQTY